MMWLDTRIAMFSQMTAQQQAEYVLSEVMARFQVGAAPLAEVLHWRSRLDQITEAQHGTGAQGEFRQTT